MGKIVMPKNSALLNEIESVLKIYYEANDWIPNDVYKARLKALIGDDQYSSSYTKKAQITSTGMRNVRNMQTRPEMYEGASVWHCFPTRPVYGRSLWRSQERGFP